MCYFLLSKNLSLAFEKNISTPQKQNYTFFWFLVCFASFSIPEKGYQNEETKSSPYLVSSARVVKLFYKFVKNFLLFFFRENKSELSLCLKSMYILEMRLLDY